MKTLSQVIEAVKAGEKPDYEDLRYTVVALSALYHFEQQAVRNLAKAKREGRRAIGAGRCSLMR